MLSILERYANYIVPMLTVVASYIVGRLQVTHDKEAVTLKEAYEKFYVPFIRLVLIQKLCDIPFSIHSYKEQIEMYNLLMNNLQYMDEEIVYAVQPFCYELTFLIAKHSGAIEGKNFLKKIQTAFLARLCSIS